MKANLTLITLAVSATLALAGCGDDDGMNTLIPNEDATPEQPQTPTPEPAPNTPNTDAPTVTEYFANTGGFSLLTSALSAVPGDTTNNLGTDIEQMSGITFLAPTDAAIQKTLDILGEQMPDLDTNKNGTVDVNELLAQPELLKSLLQYHVINETITSSEVAGKLSKNLMTANGMPLFITQSASGFAVPSQLIQLANLKADTDLPQAMVDTGNIDIEIKNGVIHVIDQALIPPTYDLDETLDMIPETASFRAFLDLIGDGSIASVATDKTAGAYTVLAPNKATLDAKCVALNPQAESFVGITIITSSNECDFEALKSISSQIGTYVPIANSIQTPTKFTGGLSDVSGEVLLPNIIATNGAIHVTDSLQ